MKVVCIALLVAASAAKPTIFVVDGERQVYRADPNRVYKDAGATCSEDGKELKVYTAGDHNEINLAVAGTYKIEYTCNGATDFASKTRTVVVEPLFAKDHQTAIFGDDHGRPIIELNEGVRQYYQQEKDDSENNWLDAGASCTYNGNDISNKVSIMGQTVRLTVQGIYKVVYNCQAEDGNTAEPVTRMVLVGPRVDDFRKANDGIAGFSNFQGGNDWNQEDTRLASSGEDTRLARDNAALTKQDLNLPVIKIDGDVHVRLQTNEHDTFQDPGATCWYNGKDVSTELVENKYGSVTKVWHLTPHGKTISLRNVGKFDLTYRCVFDGKTAETVTRTIDVVSAEALQCTTPGNYVKGDNCVPCPAGTFGEWVEPEYEGHAKILGCTACPEGSVQPAPGKTSCTPLAPEKLCRTPGMFTNAITGECDKCAPMTMEKGNQCVDCPTGQWSSEASSTCKFSECAPGTFQKADGNCQNCAVGRYQALGYTGTNNDKWGRSFCFKCPEGTFNFETGQKECAKATCPIGHFVEQTGPNNAYKCTQCAIGSASNKVGATKCTTCDIQKGEYAPFKGMSQCLVSQCKAGYHSRAFSKLKATLDAAVKTSLVEDRMHSMNNNDNLILTHAGADAAYFSSSSSGTTVFELCTMCKFNYFQEHQGQPECKPCATGFYAGYGWKRCEKITCGPGTYQRTWTVNGHTNTRCSACPLNTYSDATKPASECTPCEAGYYTFKKGSTICKKIECQPGEWQDGRYSQKKCEKCRPGTWLDVPGLNCKPCTGDRWTFVSGSTSCTYASSCSVGRYYDSETSGCKDCGVGKYGDIPNLATCKDCQVGKYQFREGQNTCNQVVCGKGKFMSDKWNSCVDCPAGTYSEQGGLTYCYKCSRGTYTYKLGSTACTSSQCKAGTFQSRLAIEVVGENGETTETTCHKCPLGTYQPEEKMFYCFKCPQGQFAHNVGQTKCTTKKECYKTRHGIMCANSQRRKRTAGDVKKCKNVSCKLAPHGGHYRMQVEHVPGVRLNVEGDWKEGSREHAEADIMDANKDNTDNFYTAHHICKSNWKPGSDVATSTCDCYCW